MITVMDLDKYTKDVSNSIERFDGFEDGLWNDYYRAQEELEFVETFDSMESYNTKLKLDMLNKINKAYGSCNRGIENYCRIQSLEAEAEAVVPTEENDKTKPAPDTNKKQKWYQIVWEKIKEFFQKIKKLFIDLWEKIKGFFSKHEEVEQEIEKAVEEAPQEEVQSLSEYLAEVSVNEDKSQKLVTLNADTASLLIKKSGEYLQNATQFSDSVSGLTQNGNADGVKKFVEMATQMYPKDGKDFNFGSMNGNDVKAYQEFKDRVNKIANSFKYDDNRDAYLSNFNSKLLNAEDGKKITPIMIMGTKNIKEIRKIFKELKSAIDKSTKNINDASNLCKNADAAFTKYIDTNTNEKNKDVTDDQKSKVLEIAGICTGMFKVVTNISNIYLNVIKDMSKTMVLVEKFTISGAQKFISALKNVGNKINKLRGKAKKVYDEKLKPEVKSSYDTIIKKIKDVKGAYDDKKVQSKLKENEVKQLISDLYRSCGSKMDKTDFIALLQGTLVDNGFVSDTAEANKYISQNNELASYLKETMNG